MPEVITDNDDDVIDEADITIIETPAAPEPDAATPAPEAASEEPDEDDDDEDARLGDSEEDEANMTPEERKRARRRKERREKNAYRARTRLRNEAELQELRTLVPDLVRQLQEVRANQQSSTQTALQAQIAQAEEDARIAGELHAQAIDAGNGREALQALDIRDRARTKLNELKALVPSAEQPQPQANPEAARLYQQWSEKNPWFKESGQDPASMLTRAIDRQVLAAGFNPGTQAYWQELTQRVSTAFEEHGLISQKPTRTAPADPTPTGMGRQHAPASTKKGIHLSAERVQAIKDAGKWDDPVARTRMIKAFQDYDRANGSPSKG